MTDARTSFVWVDYGGDDDPGGIAPYLTSFVYTDRLSSETDSLSMTFQDRDQWSADAQPKAGDTISAIIRVANWWDDGDFFELETGTLIVDEVVYRSAPAVVEIRAQSVAMDTGSSRELRSRAWEAITLRQIAADVADGGGWRLDYDLPGRVEFDRVDQRRETDLAFLNRLVRDAGGIVKVWNEILVVSDEAELEERAPVKTVTLGVNRILAYSHRNNNSTVYGSCKVSWWDAWKKKLFTYTATSGLEGPVLEAKQRATTQAQATSLAEGRLKTANKTDKSADASMSLVGDPELYAGQTVDVATGTGIDGIYLITEATHRRSSGGYITDLQLRLTVNTFVALPSLDSL